MAPVRWSIVRPLIVMTMVEVLFITFIMRVDERTGPSTISDVIYQKSTTRALNFQSQYRITPSLPTSKPSFVDKATDRLNNKNLVHFIVTYPIYNMRDGSKAALGNFSSYIESRKAMYLEVNEKEKHSITVIFLYGNFHSFKNFAAFGEQNLDQNWLCDETFLSFSIHLVSGR